MGPKSTSISGMTKGHGLFYCLDDNNRLRNGRTWRRAIKREATRAMIKTERSTVSRSIEADDVSASAHPPSAPSLWFCFVTVFLRGGRRSSKRRPCKAFGRHKQVGVGRLRHSGIPIKMRRWALLFRGGRRGASNGLLQNFNDWTVRKQHDIWVSARFMTFHFCL